MGAEAELAGGTQRGARPRVALGARGRRSGQRGAELGPPPVAAPRAGWRWSQAEELLPWPSVLARKCGSDLGRDKPVEHSLLCPAFLPTCLHQALGGARILGLQQRSAPKPRLWWRGTA